jgi:hypothetical protein
VSVSLWQLLLIYVESEELAILDYEMWCDRYNQNWSWGQPMAFLLYGHSFTVTMTATIMGHILCEMCAEAEETADH